MSSWSRQAVPLVFIEKASLAILQANDKKLTQRLEIRLEKWLQSCWDVLNSGKNKPNAEQALRKTYAAGVSIKNSLDKEMASGLTETESEVTVAMCIIAEDTIDSMPAKHPGRRPWSYLLKVLYEMWELSDPDESDSLGYERGKRIAEKVLEASL